RSPQGRQAVPLPEQDTNRVRMRWLGANPGATPVATAPASGRVNYVRGHDPVAWRYGVPLYAQVRYRDLYPGVDLVFHDENGALEYDVVVAPQGNPDVIHLEFGESQRVARGTRGEIALHTGGGDIVQRPPVAYQEVDGTKREIPVSYR